MKSETFARCGSIVPVSWFWWALLESDNIVGNNLPRCFRANENMLDAFDVRVSVHAPECDSVNNPLECAAER